MNNKKNNAKSTLVWKLQASWTSFVLKAWEWAMFPETNWIVTHRQYSWNIVTKREIIFYATRTWDVFTWLTRAFEECVQDDSQDPKIQTQNALSFDPDQWTVEVFQTITAWDYEEIIEELGVNIPQDILDAKNEMKKEIQKQTVVYWASSTWNDDYEITLDPVPESLWDLKGSIYFLADVDNNWVATLNINSLWAKTIKKKNDENLVDWDIEANQKVEVVYNSTDDVFEMVSQTSSVVNVVVDNLKRWVVLWENVSNINVLRNAVNQVQTIEFTGWNANVWITGIVTQSFTSENWWKLIDNEIQMTMGWNGSNANWTIEMFDSSDNLLWTTWDISFSSWSTERIFTFVDDFIVPKGSWNYLKITRLWWASSLVFSRNSSWGYDWGVSSLWWDIEFSMNILFEEDSTKKYIASSSKSDLSKSIWISWTSWSIDDNIDMTFQWVVWWFDFNIWVSDTWINFDKVVTAWGSTAYTTTGWSFDFSVEEFIKINTISNSLFSSWGAWSLDIKIYEDWELIWTSDLTAIWTGLVTHFINFSWEDVLLRPWINYTMTWAVQSWNIYHYVSDYWYTLNWSQMIDLSIWDSLFLQDDWNVWILPWTITVEIWTIISDSELLISWKSNKSKIITTSRANTSASATVTYTHWLWVIPKSIDISAMNDYYTKSEWIWNWENKCIYINSTSSSNVHIHNSRCINLVDTSWDGQNWYITNVTDDTFDIVWTYTPTPSSRTMIIIMKINS